MIVIVVAHFQSPLGMIQLLASDHGLAGVRFLDTPPCPQAPLVSPHPDHPVLQAATCQLTEYFARQRMRFDLPLDMRCGTDFQQSVWYAILGVAYGQTWSYGGLSAKIGRPMATRAVGAALGRNPLGIVVPCHRVVGATGALTGYAGGLVRKATLLQFEGAFASVPMNKDDARCLATLKSK